MSVLVGAGVALVTFVLGVVFSDKVKVWLRVKADDAVAKVRSKL